MRLHSISLRDFRGVQALHVQLDPNGITIIEGLNESGKTSIADAFMLLLEEKDSTTKAAVKAIQPVGRDVGPEVEAELTIGPYRLLYRKRWLRERMTELEVSAPRAEQLAGEAAHRRVHEILQSETDLTLLRALRYQQGIAISQPELHSSPSLAKALDLAAGGGERLGGTDEEALLQRVERERLRHFTPTGAATKERTQRVELLREREKEVEALEQAIGELEQTAERLRQIQIERSKLEAQKPDLDRQVEQHTQAARQIEQLELSLERAQHTHQQAQSALREAGSATERRDQLARSAESTAAEAARLEEAIAASQPRLAAAAEAVEQAKRECEKAATALDDAEHQADARSAVLDLFKLRLERDQLRERAQRVTEAEQTIATAEQFLSSCTIDDTLLAAITEAAEGLAVARGRAEAGMPRVSIEALQQVDLNVDGQMRTVPAGERTEHLVSRRLEVQVGDLVRVAVSQPQAADDAQATLSEAQNQLARLLAEAGASSVAEAHTIARRRAQHRADLASADQRREDALRDLDPAKLSAKLHRAEQRLTELEDRLDDSTLPTDSLEGAQALLNEAKDTLRAASNDHSDRQQEVDRARSALQEFKEEALVHATRLEAARNAQQEAADALQRDRQTAADDALQDAVRQAEQVLAAAQSALQAAEGQLSAADPQSTHARLRNAEKRQESLKQRIGELELEATQRRAHLEVKSADGLADRLAEARAQLQDLQRQVDSEDRRAAAAEHLHRTLLAKRQQAREAYVGPFSEKVNAYARILYGPHVEVSIDEQTLSVLHRTLDGKTVPFDSLSGGAREQLAVLTRLACAALVSTPTPAGASAPDGASAPEGASTPDGTPAAGSAPAPDGASTPEGTPAAGSAPAGVPVIIDDALGYSDPEKLQRIGAALCVAGGDCQVIVLTCEPGRYQSVGGAKIVTLP